MEIEIPCYTGDASGPPAYVHMYGACGDQLCDLGRMTATYTFVNHRSGISQVTRVDVSSTRLFAEKTYVILLDGAGLIKFTSTIFTDGSGRNDYSSVQRFGR